MNWSTGAVRINCAIINIKEGVILLLLLLLFIHKPNKCINHNNIYINIIVRMNKVNKWKYYNFNNFFYKTMHSQCGLGQRSGSAASSV